MGLVAVYRDSTDIQYEYRHHNFGIHFLGSSHYHYPKHYESARISEGSYFVELIFGTATLIASKGSCLSRSSRS